MNTRNWIIRDEAVLANVLPRVTEIVASHGKGSWLWDVDGNMYLDWASGIGVTSTGHCHDSIVSAIQKQAAQLIHTSVVTHNIKTIELAEKLGKLCPFFSNPHVFFGNSGAEAVDGSLKLARYVTGKPGVICFSRAFHGRTIGGTSLTTAKKKYREGYGQLLGSVAVCPYGSNLGAIDWALEINSDIGAMIVEPVLGEGGFVVPPIEWLRGLREKCRQHGLLLIFDEVQTGFRTGYPFAAETFGVTPDILLAAKSLASGMPLSAIIAEKSLMDKWPEGSHGSTYGGNLLSCVSALATIEVLEPLYERSRWLGKSILYRLKPWNARGIGFMVGIPLANPRVASLVKGRCLDGGLIILSCGPDDSVLRLIPPLTISDDELDIGLTILEKALEQ